VLDDKGQLFFQRNFRFTFRFFSSVEFSYVFIASCVRRVNNQQGDQIGRIFARWAIVYFGLFLKVTEVAKHFGYHQCDQMLL
jgi:hypothetical protein